MAIAIDSGNNGTQANVTSGNTMTWSHTCTGAGLMLVVAIACDNTNQPTSVTYNGVAMTLAVSRDDGSALKVHFYYLSDPATGANNVVMTASATGDYAGGSVSLTDASSQIGNTQSSLITSSTNPSVSFTTNGITGFVVDALLNRNGQSATAGAGQTRFCNQTYFNNFGSNGGLSMSYESYTSSGDPTMSWTLGTMTDSAWIGIEIKETALASGGTLTLMGV